MSAAPNSAVSSRSVRRSRLRLLVRLRRWRRGMGEVLAFLGAGAAALFDVSTGRWPAPEQARPEQQGRWPSRPARS